MVLPNYVSERFTYTGFTQYMFKDSNIRTYFSYLFYKRTYFSSLFYKRTYCSSLFYKRTYFSSLFYKRTYFSSLFYVATLSKWMYERVYVNVISWRVWQRWG